MTTSIFAQIPPLETGVSQGLAKWRSANYSDIKYKLNVTLEKGAPLMKGTIEISVKLSEEGAKNPLMLDWRTTAFANDKDKPAAEVLQVNDVVIKDVTPSGNYDYVVDKEHLYISERHLKPGENVVKINFASPIKTSGSAITRYVDKEDGAEYIYSLFVPSDASTAFPVFDQPDLKAQFNFELQIPKGWKAISNSGWAEIQKLPRRHDNFYTIIFNETKPISTYVFAFAAGEFAEFDGRGDGLSSPATSNNADANGQGQAQPLQNPDLPMKIYVRKSQIEKFKQHSAEVFRLNRESVKFLEDYFDYKFPFPKYDLVLIPEFPFGGMEHAGATFLRESSVIFPTEPTKNDYVSRANVIFHEAAHQWFGDTVTMKWFDDLWLKEGFAEFMAYKTLEKVMPEYNAWKIFYERNKQGAYLTDSTKGTTPIYQEIKNLSAAKSAYGNIVYRKAPSFLKQAEFYLGEKEFQTAVKAFLKKHEFKNAEWADLVSEFQNVGWLRDELGYRNSNAKDRENYERVSRNTIAAWAENWVKQKGLPIIRGEFFNQTATEKALGYGIFQKSSQEPKAGEYKQSWALSFNLYIKFPNGKTQIKRQFLDFEGEEIRKDDFEQKQLPVFVFPNYQDYGYGIFLLDEQSRAYVLANIQNEKEDFLRAMMWGSLWDSVREAELAPEDYVELVIKNISVETDESTIQTLLGRVSVAMNYYLPESGNEAFEGRNATVKEGVKLSSENTFPNGRVSAKEELAAKLEKLLIEKLQTAPTVGQKITYFRALQSIGSGAQTRTIFKDLLNGKSNLKDVQLKTKDKFDLVTRLLILDDKDASAILARLEKTETSDEAKRYAYAARAGIKTAENKRKFWNDFVSNKEISESWIEAAFVPFNSVRHSELTLPFLDKALAELPVLKKNRKIFFVNGWLAAFIGGQKSEQALKTINEFLDKNPNLDRDLRLKILENADNLERAVKIRAKFDK